MSGANVEVIRRTFELWAHESFEAALAYFKTRAAPEFELFPLMAGALEGSVYRGPEAVEEWYADMLEPFEELRPEAHELIDVGDHVLAIGRTFARGRKSGVASDFGWAQLWAFRDQS